MNVSNITRWPSVEPAVEDEDGVGLEEDQSRQNTQEDQPRKCDTGFEYSWTINE